jgi:hypothetical protein
LILSPENNTAYASHTVSLNVSVTMPESNNMTLYVSEIYYFASWLPSGKHVDIGQGSFNLTGLPKGPNWIVVCAAATALAYNTHTEIHGIYATTYYVAYRIASSSLINFTIDPIAPRLLSLSVENKTYSSSNVPLDVLVNEPVSQVIYSLDGQANMSVAGNMTLIGLPDGGHELTVYVKDLAGNAGNSETICFSVDASEPFPAAPVAAASVATIAVLSVGLLVYFKKRNHKP